MLPFANFRFIRSTKLLSKPTKISGLSICFMVCSILKEGWVAYIDGVSIDYPVMSKASSVRVWCENLVLPTWLPAAPDKNPMFLEKRVYQGSSGKVYPLPFTDRIQEERVDRAWRAVWLENEFLRALVLPELGGRIHALQDRTNGWRGRGLPGGLNSTGRNITGRRRICRWRSRSRSMRMGARRCGAAITIRWRA